jgi:hypothetical protein
MEQKVARLIADGSTNREIRVELGMAEGTVNSHVDSLLQKFAARRRTQLVAKMSLMMMGHADLAKVEGYWLSRFTYLSTRAREEGTQINVEKVWQEGDGFVGASIKKSNERRDNAFTHRLEFKVEGLMLRGYWDDTDTSHKGCFQLYISPDRLSMAGMHLGNSSAGRVVGGEWRWRRIRTPEDAFDAGKGQLMNHAQLEELFGPIRENERALNVADVFELPTRESGRPGGVNRRRL